MHFSGRTINPKSLILTLQWRNQTKQIIVTFVFYLSFHRNDLFGSNQVNFEALTVLSHSVKSYAKIFLELYWNKLPKSVKIFLRQAVLHRYQVFQKKEYRVTDYQYFKNGNTQQCNIFRHNKYNFLVVCEVSTLSKVMNTRTMMGQMGFG